jgi:hypothetical protein
MKDILQCHQTFLQQAQEKRCRIMKKKETKMDCFKHNQSAAALNATDMQLGRHLGFF